jgi:acetyl esterase/lipase
MKELLNLVYDKNHPDICCLDMYLPDTEAPCPVFVFFHGGGVEEGSKEAS